MKENWKIIIEMDENLYYKNGNKKYEGKWKDNKKNGKVFYMRK